MEKKYMKPSIEVEIMDVEQELMAWSIEAEISDETQDNGDALSRSPFEF
jgi:hypothetical protein